MRAAVFIGPLSRHDLTIFRKANRERILRKRPLLVEVQRSHPLGWSRRSFPIEKAIKTRGTLPETQCLSRNVHHRADATRF